MLTLIGVVLGARLVSKMLELAWFFLLCGVCLCAHGGVLCGVLCLSFVF